MISALVWIGAGGCLTITACGVWAVRRDRAARRRAEGAYARLCGLHEGKRLGGDGASLEDYYFELSLD